MRRFIIIALTIICLTCGLVGVDATRNGIRSSGLDFWNYFAESDQLESVAVKSRNLDCEIEEQNQRGQRTNLVAINLCNGDIVVKDAIESIQTLLQNSSFKDVDLRACYIFAGYLRPDAAERDTYACFLLLTIKSLRLGAVQSGDRISAAFFSDRLMPIYKEVKAQSPGLLSTILEPRD
jgi:hypothetical protein